MVSRRLPTIVDLQGWLAKFGETWDPKGHEAAFNAMMSAIASRDFAAVHTALMRPDVQALLRSFPMNSKMFTPEALDMMPPEDRAWIMAQRKPDDSAPSGEKGAAR